MNFKNIDNLKVNKLKTISRDNKLPIYGKKSFRVQIIKDEVETELL